MPAEQPAATKRYSVLDVLAAAEKWVEATNEYEEWRRARGTAGSNEAGAKMERALGRLHRITTAYREESRDG
jgi:SH3-like domain-containing protein